MFGLLYVNLVRCKIVVFGCKIVVFGCVHWEVMDLICADLRDTEEGGYDGVGCRMG